MRVRGLATVRTLVRRGLLYWVPEGQVMTPRLNIPAEFHATARQDKQTIEAVLWRAFFFRCQMLWPSPDPFLRLRDGKWCRHGCPSCGRMTAAGEFRCDLCTLGAELALVAPQPAQGILERARE